MTRTTLPTGLSRADRIGMYATIAIAAAAAAATLWGTVRTPRRGASGTRHARARAVPRRDGSPPHRAPVARRSTCRSSRRS